MGPDRHWRIFVRAEVATHIGTPERADDFVRLAVETAGMRIISGPWSVCGVIPGNEGVSSTAILDYSSVNLHEWDRDPRHLPLALIHFDLYTCGPRPDEAEFRRIFDLLGPASWRCRVVDLDELLGAA